MPYSAAEKQVISTLTWFRTRYALFLDLSMERPASKKNMEDFARIWMGKFKLDWAVAWETLIQKEVLHFADGQYAFTEKGEKVKIEIESEFPFFQYEYNSFFELERESLAHTKFCELVYGKDLSQHGLINEKELEILIEALKRDGAHAILDMGCGNGKITEYLSQQIQGVFWGLDISNIGISEAQERTEGQTNLHFKQGNMNKFQFEQKFDSILFLDTLYYTDDLEALILNCKNMLSEKGKVYAYFSQWIMEESYKDNLLYNQTHLANILNKHHINYTAIDLSDSGKKHWKDKRNALLELKNEFFEEGNGNLWNYRYNEAKRYANWGDDKYARYFYEINYFSS